MITDFFYSPFLNEASLIAVADAKDHLRIEQSIDDEDSLIQAYIDAAQGDAENYINRVIGRRRLVINLDCFQDVINFERSSNDKIESIKYFPLSGGGVETLSASQYRLRDSSVINCLDINLSRPYPETAIRPDAVVVTITQGYSVADCPAPIIQAMKLAIGDYYERREDRDVGNGAISKNLLRPYRKYV